MKVRLNLAGLLIFVFCVGCTSGTRESAKPSPQELRPHDSLFSTQIIPTLKLEQDTINLGDSLIATIGVIFSPKLTDEQKKEIINSLSYHMDLSSTRDDPADSLFSKNHRISDSSFRISLLPNALNYKKDKIIKREFHAHIKMNFLNDPKLYLFGDVFTYYVRSN